MAHQASILQKALREVSVELGPAGSNGAGDAPIPHSLRIAFLSHQFPPGNPGGIGRFTQDLAQGFAQHGHDTHVFSVQGSERSVSSEQGVWVHRIPDFSDIPEPLAREPIGSDLARIGTLYRHVLRLHTQARFDLISSPIWLAEGLLLALDRRFATVVSLHTATKTLIDLDGYWHNNARSAPLAVLEQASLAAHRHTHANSHASLAKVSAQYGAPRGPRLLYHGVADRSGQFARRRRDGKIRLLTVGRQEIRKGADVLLDVIPRLLERNPDLDVVMVGPPVNVVELGDRTLANAIRERCEDYPEILARAQFTGFVSDDALYQHYCDADIFVFPSRYESFGLPIIEAMSFGLSIVACRGGAIEEILTDGEDGILLPVGDRDGIIQAVEALSKSAEGRNRLGASARRKYLQQFSHQVSIPKTISAYRAIIESSDPKVDAFNENEVVRRFSELIEQCTALQRRDAIRCARQLMGLKATMSDFPAKVTKIWKRNDRDFVIALHRALAGCELSEAEAIQAVLMMTRLGGRLPFIEHSLSSQELYRGEPPADWRQQMVSLALTERNAGTWYEHSVRRRFRREFKKVMRLLSGVRRMAIFARHDR